VAQREGKDAGQTKVAGHRRELGELHAQGQVEN
jgi:hypothetical protein